MLLSMTGFGDARFQDQRWSIQVEVRTVNNRHLKLSTKISEPYTALEAEFEHLVPRAGTAGDRPDQHADRTSPAGRGLPVEHRGDLASYRDQLRASKFAAAVAARWISALLLVCRALSRSASYRREPARGLAGTRRRGEPGARPPGGGPHPGRPVDGRGAEVGWAMPSTISLPGLPTGAGRGAIVPEAPHRACAVAGPRPRGGG